MSDHLDFYPTAVIDGVTYAIPVDLTIKRENGHTMYLVEGDRKPVNSCARCGRADWVQRVAYSVEEAVKYGLLVPK